MTIDPVTQPAPVGDEFVKEDVADEASVLRGSADKPQKAQASSRLEVGAIRIRNFKKIVDARIKLGPITYLVGGNNSGKSSFLQAIHTAVSCAQASVDLGQRVVAEASLRYSPVADFSLLGHGAPYENRSGGSRGIVNFEGVAADSSEEADYRIEMYKARNHNNVGVDRSGLSLGFGQIISDPKTLFSVYVPGLAGVPHREEMSGFAAVFRKAASGDANLVFRNIIRLLDDRKLLRDLESLLQDVIKAPVFFKVDYDPDRDLYVDVRLATGEDANERVFLPVDLWGTGLLQVTQIFAYVLLFKPALLLVDEPDSHLHPSHQKSLSVALEQVASRFNCKVLVSTHSRHLITGASDAVKVVWMKNGGVESDENRELTAILMDLGALDQLDRSPRTILCTEDENPWALRLALESLGLSDEDVKIASFNGLGNAFSAEAFREMADLMDSTPRVIIHRDRDFLTDQELTEWCKVFEDREIEVFCPTLCDSEAYHATAHHISDVVEIQLEEAMTLRAKVIDANLDKLRGKLKNKRRTANSKYLDGGAPRTEEMWPENADVPDHLLYGKDLLKLVEHELRALKLLSKGASLSDRVAAGLADELRVVLSEGGSSEFRFGPTPGSKK